MIPTHPSALQSPSAGFSRGVVLSAVAAVGLHAIAGYLAFLAPGARVIEPPVPLEVRFVVEAPPQQAAAPTPAPPSPPAEPPPAPKPPPPKPEPKPEPPPKPAPRPVSRPAPPEPTRTIVSESPKAAEDAPTAPPPPVPAPPAAPVETLPAPVAVAPPAAAAAVAPAPAAAAAPAGPVTSAPRFDAAYLANPPPAYPMISRRLGEEGRVMLRVFVEADGRPSKVELRDSSGFGRLDDAALRAVRGWRFVPARRGDEAVAAWVLVPINFTLKNS